MAQLNESHRRALGSAFKHIEDLLSSIEAACAPPSSPFARHFGDLSPTQQRVVADYLSRIRGQMADALKSLEIPIGPPRVAASWAIQTALSFARIGVQEIAPSRLRGYGPLDAESSEAIERLEADLERTIQRLQAYLAQRLGKDLSARLDRLERAPVNLGLVRALERIVTARGLIEFRGALEALLDRIEADTFEIAVFGRVSSGKSSLLNTVLGFAALPVGVTPVTAVPMRLVWGETAAAEIHFAEAPAEEIPLERLAEYVSEEHNPENHKHVTRALARLPSPVLRQGVVFVDTPGVGSLATSGARESYAYLPRCDLGVLLLDAASTPTREDFEILRLLYDSGIPGKVVISKADLLSEPDRVRMREYVRAKIAEDLELDLPVDLVSAVRGGTELARGWFEREIAPLTARARELAQASARRKLESLREGVAAALRVVLDSRSRGPSTGAPDSKAVERLALEAEGEVQEATRRCENLLEEIRDLARPALRLAAAEYARQTARGERSTPLEEMTRRVVGTKSEDTRERLRRELLALRDRLGEILSRMAREAGTDPLQLEKLGLDLVSQPTLEVPGELEGLDARAGRWLRRWPSLLERRVQKSLLSWLEGPLTKRFRSFDRRLREWLRATLASLADQFAAHAEPLRALARRTAEGGAPENLEGIAADLRELETEREPVATPARMEKPGAIPA